MGDLAFDHAGAPLPPDLPLAESSDVEPLGSAGLVNQGSGLHIESAGAAYSSAASASADAAMSKRHSDWTSLMGGHTPASSDGGY